MTKLVFIENQRPITDSLIIAETFSKDHKHVLRDIAALECSEEFRQSNFGLSSYTSLQNKDLPKYLITQDGFTFLVMGYTGKDASHFKELYINEFNKMRDQLSSPQISPPQAGEFGSANKILNLLHENTSHLNTETKDAMRLHIIELLGGQKQPQIPASSTTSTVLTVTSATDYDEKWYLTAELAKMIGVSTQMVASMSSKHKMRNPEFCRLAKTEPSRVSGLVQVMYNEKGKDKLTRLLSNIAKRAVKNRKSSRRG